MRLFICRHGKAEPTSPTGLDADRPLTDKGHRQAAHVGAALAALDAPPTRLLASPLVRAQQTAAHLAQALALEAETAEVLAVDRGASAILARLGEVAQVSGDPKAQRLLLVGHNPDLSILASMLLFGSPRGVELRTGHCIAMTAKVDTTGLMLASGRDQAAYRLSAESSS